MEFDLGDDGLYVCYYEKDLIIHHAKARTHLYGKKGGVGWISWATCIYLARW